MGGGASAQQAAQLEQEVAEQKRLVQQKEEELAKMSAQLEEVKRERATLIQQQNTTAGETKAGKKKRRVEVSAEILPNPGEEEEIARNYKKKVFKKDKKTKAMLRNVVSKNLLFKLLSKQERDECIDGFEKLQVAAGDTIIQQGEQGDHFYVVQTGAFEILVAQGDNGPEINFGEITAGRGFGELALMYNTPRAATIKAKAASVVYSLHRSTYKNITIHYKVMKNQKFVAILRDVPILQCLKKEELNRMAGALEEETYEPGDVIIRQGEDGDYFYIMETGEVKVTIADDTGAVSEAGSISAGGYFGEKALLTEEKRAATITSVKKSRVLTLNRANFTSLLGSLQDLIDRVPGGAPREAEAKLETMEECQYHVDIAWGDLEIMAPLGEGAFGRVKLVRRRGTEETYALKCMAKQDIVDSNLQDHVVNEKNVMIALNHPFILRLHNTFKDQRYLYLLIELALGGEMFTSLRNAGRFSEKASKFYAASVVLAFEHMHNKNIIYRDLKPENLLLDSGGFLKVADFGLAKVCTERTYTLCGTPDYLAPEIILSKGHGKAVDYWALGVLIHEMTTGVVPFYSEDPMEVYQLILAHDLRVPSFLAKPCKELITQLLEENPAKRLGNLRDGTKDIIKARWFSGFDWAGLLAKTMRPPIVPQVTNKTDTRNFDFVDEGEKDAPICEWEPDF